MTTLGVHEAKTHLSRLLRRVAAREEVLITSGGELVARLVLVTGRPLRRVLGIDRGLIRVADDFDELPHEELEGWEA